MCLNDDKAFIERNTPIRDPDNMTAKDISEFLIDRIHQVLVWTMGSLKLSKHDIKSICDIMVIDDLSENLGLPQEYYWLQVSVNIDTSSQTDNCRDLTMIAQNFFSKINVLLFICRGANGLWSLSLKFSRTELMKDPLGILARF